MRVGTRSYSGARMNSLAPGQEIKEKMLNFGSSSH